MINILIYGQEILLLFTRLYEIKMMNILLIVMMKIKKLIIYSQIHLKMNMILKDLIFQIFLNKNYIFVIIY